MFAPLRPCCAIVLVFSLNKFIKPTGPHELPPVPKISSPPGLRIDKSWPQPPPYLYVIAS